MILYTVQLDKQAQKHKDFWQKNAPKEYRKLLSLLDELEIHPRTGTGNPKTLKSDRTKWAREINKKDRLIYRIYETTITVEVISAKGHYDDH